MTAATPHSGASNDELERGPRVLIMAEHASARFGGEASLPLHYFRVLLARGIPVWLITHGRVRRELQTVFPGSADRIFYIDDTWVHLALWKASHWLPARMSYLTTDYLMRIVTQRSQRSRKIKRLQRRLGAAFLADASRISVPRRHSGRGAAVR